MTKFTTRIPAAAGMLAATLVAAAGPAPAASPLRLEPIRLEPDRMVVGGSVRIEHRLNAPARLVVTIERLGERSRVVGSASVPAPAGRAATRLSGTKLRPGRHRVRVRATDDAGRRSRERTAVLRVLP